MIGNIKLDNWKRRNKGRKRSINSEASNGSVEEKPIQLNSSNINFIDIAKVDP